jgi:hypothetical protein
MVSALLESKLPRRPLQPLLFRVLGSHRRMCYQITNQEMFKTWKLQQTHRLNQQAQRRSKMASMQAPLRKWMRRLQLFKVKLKK